MSGSDAFTAFLRGDAAFGVPDVFLNAEGFTTSSPADLTAGLVSGTDEACDTLLTSNQRALLRAVNGCDPDRLRVAYRLDSGRVDANSLKLREAIINTNSVSSPRRTDVAWQRQAKLGITNVSPGAERQHVEGLVLRSHAVGHFDSANVARTHTAANAAGGMSGIFCKLSLLSIALADGGSLSLRLDVDRARELLPVGLLPAQEPTASAGLAGLVVQTSNYSPADLALLAYGCGCAVASGVATGTYDFPDLPFTAVGVMPTASLQHYAGAEGARDVVAMLYRFAHAYGILDELTAAYQTALVLFGAPTRPISILLDVTEPRFNEFFASRTAAACGVAVGEQLASRAIVSVAKLFGAGAMQCMRDLLRVHVRTTRGIIDRHAIPTYNLLSDIKLLQAVGERLQVATGLAGTALLDPMYHAHSWAEAAWDYPGVLASAACGFAVEGGAVAAAVMPIHVPYPDEASGPTASHDHSQLIAEANLRRSWLNALIVDGGAALVSARAVPQQGVAAETNLYSGATVTMVLCQFVGYQAPTAVGDYVELPPNPVNQTLFPAEDEEATQAEPTVAEPTVHLQSALAGLLAGTRRPPTLMARNAAKTTGAALAGLSDVYVGVEEGRADIPFDRLHVRQPESRETALLEAIRAGDMGESPLASTASGLREEMLRAGLPLGKGATLEQVADWLTQRNRSLAVIELAREGRSVLRVVGEGVPCVMTLSAAGEWYPVSKSSGTPVVFSRVDAGVSEAATQRAVEPLQEQETADAWTQPAPDRERDTGGWN